MTPTRLGPALREARERRDLTKRQVAAAMHVHPSQLYRWETGTRPLPVHYAEAYAAVLGLDLVLVQKPTAGGNP